LTRTISARVSELRMTIWAPRIADAYSDVAAALKAQGDADAAAREIAIARRLQQAPRPRR